MCFTKHEPKESTNWWEYFFQHESGMFLFQIIGTKSIAKILCNDHNIKSSAKKSDYNCKLVRKMLRIFNTQKKYVHGEEIQFQTDFILENRSTLFLQNHSQYKSRKGYHFEPYEMGLLQNESPASNGPFYLLTSNIN